MIVLKEKCLEIIIDNFDSYFLAYYTAENLSEKIRYEYLRRNYSFQFAQSLKKRNSFHIDYIDFIINKYLKSLDTHWLADFPWDVISRKFIEIGPSLEKVYFNDADHPWEEIICHLPNLLSVSFDEGTDSYLELIAKFCPKIQSINCTTSSIVTRDGLKHICCQENGQYPCPELKEIGLGLRHAFYQRISPEDIGYLLKNLPSLEKFECLNLPDVLYAIHKDEINVLDKIKPYNLIDINLKNLDPHDREYYDTLKICVSLCPNVVRFSCTVRELKHLELCSQLPKLQILNLNSVQVPPLSLDNFLTIKGSLLTHLEICNFSLAISCVFQNCHNLNTLNMSRICFQHDESVTDSVLSGLKDLRFQDLILIDAVTVEAVTSMLSCSPNVESLSFLDVELYSSNIQAEFIKCCEHNKLQNIDFRGSRIDDKFVRDILLTCSSLTTLNLEYCDYDYEEIERLENIALTLPNRPYILYNESPNSDSSDDYDDFVNEYDDFLNTDDDDDDEDDYEYSDVDDFDHDSFYDVDY